MWPKSGLMFKIRIKFIIQIKIRETAVYGPEAEAETGNDGRMNESEKRLCEKYELRKSELIMNTQSITLYFAQVKFELLYHHSRKALNYI